MFFLPFFYCPTSCPNFFNSFFLPFFYWGGGFQSILTRNHISLYFFLYFNLKKWISYRSRFFLCNSSSECGVVLFGACTSLFDIPSCSRVHLIPTEDQLFNQWFERQRCRSETMNISVIFSFIVLFVGILYAINLDVMSLLSNLF